MDTTLAKFKMIGTTDEVTECDCCGRKNLKSTVALEVAEGDDAGDIVYFGSACGARAVGWGVKEFKKSVKTADEAREDAARAARKAQADAEFNEYAAWVCQTYNLKNFNDLPFAKATEALTAYRAQRK